MLERSHFTGYANRELAQLCLSVSLSSQGIFHNGSDWLAPGILRHTYIPFGSKSHLEG
jgi:hypothetical protein